MARPTSVTFSFGCFEYDPVSKNHFESLYLDGAHLDEIYPVSIPTHFLALNITISGYRDHLGFGYTACRRSVPALQRMLDYTDQSIRELEASLGLETKHSVSKSSKTTKGPAAKVAARTRRNAKA